MIKGGKSGNRVAPGAVNPPGSPMDPGLVGLMEDPGNLNGPRPPTIVGASGLRLPAGIGIFIGLPSASVFFLGPLLVP